MVEEQVAAVEEPKQDAVTETSETKAEVPAEKTKKETQSEPNSDAPRSKRAEPKKKVVKSSVAVQKEENANPTEIKEQKEVKKIEEKPSAEDLRKKKFAHLKLFNRWQTDVVVSDAGLKPYMNLSPVLVPWSAGRNIKKQFWKSKKSIVERLMLKLMVTGHKGKKHYHTSGPNAGQLVTIYKAVQKTFEIVEQKTKKNPIEVFIRAIEIGSPREGVSYIEYGGVRYPKAADMSPQRRIDLVLRWMTQTAFVQSFKGKKHVWDALADEIIATANNDATKSACLAKRTDLERQAGASR
ncbi:MAG: hypothetical protein HY438_03700 [DPANN group archaeon]|nr:hypothetical protein [DPANN group archaeon]